MVKLTVFSYEKPHQTVLGVDVVVPGPLETHGFSSHGLQQACSIIPLVTYMVLGPPFGTLWKETCWRTERNMTGQDRVFSQGGHSH